MPPTPHSHLMGGRSLSPCTPHTALTPGRWVEPAPPVPLTLHSHLVGRKNLSLCATHTHTNCITCPFTDLLHVSGEQVLSKCLWHELP